MDNEKIEFTKKYHSTNNNAIKQILKENNRCLICGNKTSSFCHSHSIPLKILNKMNLKNGTIVPFQNAAMMTRLKGISVGKHNCSIFRNICSDCDQLFFSKLDNMDVINDNWTNELLRLQAIRILLFQIHRSKEFAYSFYDFSEENLSQNQINSGKEYDINSATYYTNILNRMIKNKKETYQILFSKTLDYEINFACTCLMNIKVIPFFNTIFIPGSKEQIEIETHELDDEYHTIVKLDKRNEANSMVYLVALPSNEKTKILLFCDNNSIANPFITTYFEEMSEKQILNYVSATLVIFGHNIYGNDLFVEKYRKNCEIFKVINYLKNSNTSIANLTTNDIKFIYQHLMDDSFNLFYN